MDSREPLPEMSAPSQLGAPSAEDAAWASRSAFVQIARAQWSRLSVERVVFWSALGVAVLAVSTRIALEVSKHVFSAWTSFRLGFSAQLVAGIDLYPALGTGPVIGDIYGPFAAVFYLPALLAPTPTLQVLAAQLYTVAWVGGLLTLACVLRVRHGAVSAACVAVLGLAAMLALPGLCHCLTQIHADAPCVVLGVLSCLVWRDATRFEAKRSAASALLWALAVLSKQQALFVLVAQCLLLWRWFGLRFAALHAVLASSALVLGFYVLAFAFGSQPSAIWFNAITVPASHPLQFAREWLALSRFVALVPPLLAFWCATWCMCRASSVARRDVQMLVGASLALVPVALLSGMKEGGYLNNYHAQYYAVFATCLAAVDALSRSGAAGVSKHRIVLAGVTLASVLLVPSDLEDELPGFKDVLLHLEASPHERASAYLREHSDAYFPWHTLENAQQLGLAYHSFDGLRTMKLAGRELSPAAFAKFAPKSPRYIVMPKEGRGIPPTLKMIKRYYRGYHTVNPPAELEGFTVYSR
jgi:hypothetical protein